jgi:ATP-dependent helicase HrpB
MTIRGASASDGSDALPITALRAELLAALSRGPVVISSPTGSGKSTEVPRWCEPPVLVIEPRRIACRSLAARVAWLERTELGAGVGYIVRDEHVASDATRIVFATPGVVIRHRRLLDAARTVILDEMHERSLEVDMLLALLVREKRTMIVMSATLDGERVAAHVGGTHLAAEGRAFPVDVRYVESAQVLPSATDLAIRVERAVAASAGAADAGDVLVFLPGKAEIEACAQALRGLPVAIVPLHGGLALDEQRRAFESARRRKVILATNVAETSLTIPGIGVVIDSGLVRQTRYHEGRGFLALVPIAEDSAAQRAGRAGRTGPGVCYRLWSASARLEKTTLPEIHRESLVPLVMGVAAWGERVEGLPWLDPPRPYALEAARADLMAWGALEGSVLSESGRALHALPLDPAHARLLVAARAERCLEDMIDLVAVLSVGRPLFATNDRGGGAPDDGLRAAGCDVTAMVAAVRGAEGDVSRFVLDEARRTRARLRRLEGLPDRPPVSAAIDRDAMVRAVIGADPRSVHVARARGRDTLFANGGTEIELARESAVRNVKNVEAIVVLDTRALGAGTGREQQRVLVTCAMAIPVAVIAQAGLGHDRLGGVTIDGQRVVSTIERVYAKRVIAVREETPTGALARDALVTLLERGSLFRAAIATTRERLARRALAAKLAAIGHPAGVATDEPVGSVSEWLRARLVSLGVESGDDLAMLSASDFIATELPIESRAVIDRELPATVSVGDATYRAEYDLDRSEVVLHMVSGNRKDPPPLAYLPKFPGLRISVASARGVTVVRPRG